MGGGLMEPTMKPPPCTPAPPNRMAAIAGPAILTPAIAVTAARLGARRPDWTGFDRPPHPRPTCPATTGRAWSVAQAWHGRRQTAPRRRERRSPRHRATQSRTRSRAQLTGWSAGASLGIGGRCRVGATSIDIVSSASLAGASHRARRAGSWPPSDVGTGGAGACSKNKGIPDRHHGSGCADSRRRGGELVGGAYQFLAPTCAMRLHNSNLVRAALRRHRRRAALVAVIATGLSLVLRARAGY